MNRLKKLSLYSIGGLACLAGMFAAVHAYERPVLDTSALEAEEASELVPVEKRADLTVDLHAHLFMKSGMPILFRGRFFGPIRARNWKSRFSNQTNPETVQRSGLGVIVVSLYANPLLTWSSRAAVREQIRQAELFVAQHPGWIIARDPEQARAALDQGKRVLVLSLERASWVLDNERDLKEFIDEKGIRIVTFLHLTDDFYGGAAFMKGFRKLSNPLRWFVEIFKPHFSRDGTRVNGQGLTQRGRMMAARLIERGVWLDLSHASDAAQKQLVPMLKKAGQPLLYTHGGLRRFVRVERGLSDAQLEAVRADDGLIGICPSEDVVNPTRVPKQYCGGPSCKGSCDWGLPGFVAQYAAAVQALGPANVLIGSDFNGAIPHLHPSCGTGTELDRFGLWNIGQMEQFWIAVKKLGAPVPPRLSDQIDSFLLKWSRVRSQPGLLAVE